jgi:hypothetical protein
MFKVITSLTTITVMFSSCAGLSPAIAGELPNCVEQGKCEIANDTSLIIRSNPEDCKAVGGTPTSPTHCRIPD